MNFRINCNTQTTILTFQIITFIDIIWVDYWVLRYIIMGLFLYKISRKGNKTNSFPFITRFSWIFQIAGIPALFIALSSIPKNAPESNI